MATAKEKELLQVLYNFYVEDDNSKLQDGDQVTYNKPDSKHTGKIGIFKGVRKEDGQMKIKFDNIILYASKKYVKKIGKPKNVDRLIKILDQMVEDGDLSQKTMDTFTKELEISKERKVLDPYDEENWDDEDSIILEPKKKKKDRNIVRIPLKQDPCGRERVIRGGC
jgi:hypothetical protein